MWKSSAAVMLALSFVVCEGLTTPGLVTRGAPRCHTHEKCRSGLWAVPFDEEEEEESSVVSSAALIAGTTIGGGFLALPSATAPLGAAPSVLGLSVVWLFLLGTSFSMVDSIFMLNKNVGASDSSVFRFLGEESFDLQPCEGMLWGRRGDTRGHGVPSAGKRDSSGSAFEDRDDTQRLVPNPRQRCLDVRVLCTCGCAVHFGANESN